MTDLALPLALGALVLVTLMWLDAAKRNGGLMAALDKAAGEMTSCLQKLDASTEALLGAAEAIRAQEAEIAAQRAMLVEAGIVPDA